MEVQESKKLVLFKPLVRAVRTCEVPISPLTRVQEVTSCLVKPIETSVGRSIKLRMSSMSFKPQAMRQRRTGCLVRSSFTLSFARVVMVHLKSPC